MRVLLLPLSKEQVVFNVKNKLTKSKTKYARNVYTHMEDLWIKMWWKSTNVFNFREKLPMTRVWNPSHLLVLLLVRLVVCRVIVPQFTWECVLAASNKQNRKDANRRAAFLHQWNLVVRKRQNRVRIPIRILKKNVGILFWNARIYANRFFVKKYVKRKLEEIPRDQDKKTQQTYPWFINSLVFPRSWKWR